jgi:hypothetical protein
VDIATLILGTGTVIGKVQGFLDQAVEIDIATFAAAATRMLQHALHDIVGTSSVLGDFFEVAGEHFDRLANLGTLVVIQRTDCWSDGLLQFIEQFDREPGEIVDEVERILDLVRDAPRSLGEKPRAGVLQKRRANCPYRASFPSVPTRPTLPPTAVCGSRSNASTGDRSSSG